MMIFQKLWQEVEDPQNAHLYPLEWKRIGQEKCQCNTHTQTHRKMSTYSTKSSKPFVLIAPLVINDKIGNSIPYPNTQTRDRSRLNGAFQDVAMKVHES
jgi:hypothetical protein